MTDEFVPEADAAEQRQPLGPEDTETADTGDVPDDADEADALEQAQVLPDDEGYDATS